MATVTKGRTFTSGETVTPTKLNDIVDNATVTNIVNADISASAAIALSKLATGALPTAITVTSANLVDGTIVNADISASAAIVDTKLATISTAGKVSNSATTATNANTASAIVARDASGNFSAGTITANLTGTASAIADNTVTSAKIVDGTIVNADISASAAIAGTKIAPNFGNQVVIAATGTAAAPGFAFNGDTNTGFCRPATDTIALCVAGTERMRLNSSGNVMVGTSTQVNAGDGTAAEGITFYAGDSIHISNSGAAAALFRRTTSNGTLLAFYRSSSSAVGSISVTTTGTAYNTTSDYRLKQNATPLINALATIEALNPCQFTWKSDGSISRGFIAHELQAVVPEAVTGEKDAVDAEGKPDYQGVDASKLVPYLVSAVKELKTRVEALEAAQ